MGEGRSGNEAAGQAAGQTYAETQRKSETEKERGAGIVLFCFTVGKKFYK